MNRNLTYSMPTNNPKSHFQMSQLFISSRSSPSEALPWCNCSSSKHIKDPAYDTRKSRNQQENSPEEMSILTSTLSASKSLSKGNSYSSTQSKPDSPNSPSCH